MKRKIQRKIYVAYVIKKLTDPVALRVYLVATFVCLADILVDTLSVDQNMLKLHEAGETYRFFLYAIVHTEFSVKMLFCAATLFFIILTKDTMQKIGASKPFHAFQSRIRAIGA